MMRPVLFPHTRRGMAGAVADLQAFLAQHAPGAVAEELPTGFLAGIGNSPGKRMTIRRGKTELHITIYLVDHYEGSGQDRRYVMDGYAIAVGVAGECAPSLQALLEMFDIQPTGTRQV